MRQAGGAGSKADTRTGGGGTALRGPSRQRPPARQVAAAAARGGGGSTDAAAAHAAAAAAAAGRDSRREVAVLGGEDFILSQRSGVSEDLFKGNLLGVDADVAGVTFRQTHLRSLAHVPTGLRPSPRFLERVAVHYARNVLAGLGSLPGQVPLVLGIWGPKGAGKTFTLELCLQRMGVTPVCLSAGELEDEWAGEPGRRLRERYAFAAQHAESTGEASCLVISDLDAGVGTFANTANTVNTQILQGSLMALCDDPTAVSQGQDWAAVRSRPRVPIYVTANDLTCLYAPLVREGRMDKFFFEPNREEMAAALCPLFAPELDAAAVGALLDAFPAQPMDFFGAIKSRLVDGAVRRWLAGAVAGGKGINAALLNSASGARSAELPLKASLAAALAAGRELALEQQAVLDVRLSRDYMKGLEDDIQEEGARQGRWQRHAAADTARRLAAAEAAEGMRRAAADAVRAKAAAARAEAAATAAAADSGASQAGGPAEAGLGAAADAAGEAPEVPPPAPPPTASGLPGVTPDALAAALRGGHVAVLDVRGVRDWDWGRIKGATHTPYVLMAGSSLKPEARPNPGFLACAAATLGPPATAPPVVLYGPGAPLDSAANASFVSKESFVSVAPNGTATVDGEDIVAAAARTLVAAGYTSLSELAGGYRSWDLAYRPDGRRRAKGAFRDKSSGELEWWTASN